MAPGPFFPGYVTKGDFNSIDATPQHELGVWGYGGSGKILQYVKYGASQNLKKYNWVGLDLAATGLDAANTVGMLLNQATHAPFGVAEYGGTAGSYGWVTRYGPATAKTAATDAQGVALINQESATGILSSKGWGAGSTFVGLQGFGVGVLVGTPSVTGTLVNVKCI